jgi:hypothetical protein
MPGVGGGCMNWKKLFGIGRSQVPQENIEKAKIQLGFSEEVITILRTHTNSPLQPLVQQDLDTDASAKTVGISFQTNESEAEEMVAKLNAEFKGMGYHAFICNHDYEEIGILKGIDQFDILKIQQTNGDNYDIGNDEVIAKLKAWHQRYPFTIIGADFDWVEANFKVIPENKELKAFAEEIYKFCPDIVDQGSGSIDCLIEDMKETKKLYLWWD